MNDKRKLGFLVVGLFGGTVLMLAAGYVSPNEPNAVGIVGMALAGVSGGYLLKHQRSTHD